jgi:hypothetical protein
LVLAPLIIKYLPISYAKAARDFGRFCAQQLQLRQKNGPRQRKDLFHWLLAEGEDVKQSAVQINQGQLMADTLAIIVAVSSVL